MIGVVSHDAGGAEIISSWLKNHNKEFISCLKGPALDIFSRKFKNLENLEIEQAVTNSDFLLCGSSWKSTIENKALTIAKSKNIKSAVYLDHWVNYEERFIYKEKFVFPDEIWVADKYALKIAKKI